MRTGAVSSVLVVLLAAACGGGGPDDPAPTRGKVHFDVDASGCTTCTVTRFEAYLIEDQAGSSGQPCVSHQATAKADGSGAFADHVFEDVALEEGDQLTAALLAFCGSQSCSRCAAYSTVTIKDGARFDLSLTQLPICAKVPASFACP